MSTVIERIWLLLVALTLAGAWLAETGQVGWLISLCVAGLIMLKGRLVIDHYMEMAASRTRLRLGLYGFITLIPILVLLSHGWGETIRHLTRLH